MNGYADQRAHDVFWMTAAEREALDTRMDETARILAEHGDAQKIAVYAIYGAHQAYRDARAAAEAPWIAAGKPAGPVWDETARKINAAAAERRRALTGILVAYELSKPAGQDDNYEISTARGYLTPLPAYAGNVASPAYPGSVVA